MKKIETIIRTSKFEDVKQALKENGIDFISYWEASGIGNEHTKGHHSYRGLYMIHSISQECSYRSY
ncbi:MAG: hypothetical protein NTZ19_03005 [Bacteroidetes bacterium]|nr:hypothetical protein [Bacteroidota bacterium]